MKSKEELFSFLGEIKVGKVCMWNVVLLTTPTLHLL